MYDKDSAWEELLSGRKEGKGNVADIKLIF